MVSNFHTEQLLSGASDLSRGFPRHQEDAGAARQPRLHQVPQPR